jgi:hypothetical protein
MVRKGNEIGVEAMSKVKLATYDEPMATAIKACQWHDENDGPAVVLRARLYDASWIAPQQPSRRDDTTVMRRVRRART